MNQRGQITSMLVEKPSHLTVLQQSVPLIMSNAGDTHLCTILCHNLPHGELWLIGVC